MPSPSNHIHSNLVKHHRCCGIQIEFPVSQRLFFNLSRLTKCTGLGQICHTSNTYPLKIKNHAHVFHYHCFLCPPCPLSSLANKEARKGMVAQKQLLPLANYAIYPRMLLSSSGLFQARLHRGRGRRQQIC